MKKWGPDQHVYIPIRMKEKYENLRFQSEDELLVLPPALEQRNHFYSEFTALIWQRQSAMSHRLQIWSLLQEIKLIAVAVRNQYNWLANNTADQSRNTSELRIKSASCTSSLWSSGGGAERGEESVEPCLKVGAISSSGLETSQTDSTRLVHRAWLNKQTTYMEVFGRLAPTRTSQTLPNWEASFRMLRETCQDGLINKTFPGLKTNNLFSQPRKKILLIFSTFFSYFRLCPLRILVVTVHIMTSRLSWFLWCRKYDETGIICKTWNIVELAHKCGWWTNEQEKKREAEVSPRRSAMAEPPQLSPTQGQQLFYSARHPAFKPCK